MAYEKMNLFEFTYEDLYLTVRPMLVDEQQTLEAYLRENKMHLCDKGENYYQEDVLQMIRDRKDLVCSYLGTIKQLLNSPMGKEYLKRNNYPQL